MSDDESIDETIATLSANESEDESGRYIDEKSNIRLFKLLKSIREDDPKLYENPKFFLKETPEVDKKSIMDEYFESLTKEKKPKKSKKSNEKELEIEKKANIFLKE